MPFKKGQSGNPHGSPKKPEIEQLRKAIEKVQKEQGTDLLEYFVQQAYKDKNVLIALGKKILPDCKEMSGSLQVDLPQVVIKKVGSKDDKV